MAIQKILDFITGDDAKPKTESVENKGSKEPIKSPQEIEKEQLAAERANLEKLWNQLQNLPTEEQRKIVGAINMLKAKFRSKKSQGIQNPGQGRNI